MSTDHSKFHHISGPLAVNLAKQIDAVASSADTLCKSGFSGPIAIEIARQMAAGTGNAKVLFEFCGFSTSDAAAVASAISAARTPRSAR
jgi:hypothetical protein